MIDTINMAQKARVVKSFKYKNMLFSAGDTITLKAIEDPYKISKLHEGFIEIIEDIMVYDVDSIKNSAQDEVIKKNKN